MAAKRPAKVLTVSATRHLTPNMLRLTLHGQDLDQFPDNADGAYFKLSFAEDNAPTQIMRTYTVANLRKELHEMDVDFMLHGDGTGGVAAAWALQANVGDTISLFGPGPATFINLEADWYLLAADMTALPALTTNLAHLPSNATGHIVIEILTEEDRQTLPVPANMELTWVVNPHAGSDDSPLMDAIQNLHWLEGQPAIWTACEFKTMKKLRQYYRELRSVPKSHLYISSYWKMGLKEEEHKIAKRDDSTTT